MRILFAGIILALAWSCKQSEVIYDKPYFDFDSLITRQQQALLTANATLTKTVTLDGSTEEITFAIDSVVLTKELDVFKQLDIINKPGFKGKYKISDGEKDSRSNLTIRRYEALETNTPVPFVLFYYQNEFNRLHKIESAYRENNTLYGTGRNLLLEFDDASGSPLLVNYRLTGVQKMILSDTIGFSIEGTLVPGIF
ncbi:MAG TPA: hypothetical protein PLM56_04005 [Cyclobacteriaceae bacterium]|jgi:hypothetical protein|nr:hypothetical protein [Cytophagales bacterium]HNT49587.1 hypothetical protein [Cyclobacteriaceae bacterium]HRE65444.1 hypothetical protein [Cyclobacteriaceae bacterium]HRF32638.1 hypothetical protein [Cyclobacteriaceae bacterium]